MKQLTFGILLTAMLAAFAWTVSAEEAIVEAEGSTQVVEQAVAEPVSDSAVSADPATLDFPLAPEFAASFSEGGTCTPCSSHGNAPRPAEASESA